MMNSSKRQRFRWQWILATTLAWCVVPLIGLAGLLLRQPIQAFALMPLAGFVLVGVAQWAVIRRYGQSGASWAFTGLPAGIVSGAFMASQVWTQLSAVSLPFFLAGLVALSGWLLGLSQWWLLKTHYPKADRWIVITALAWSGGFVLALGIAIVIALVAGAGGGLERSLWAIIAGGIIGLALMGMIAGIITAIGLLWLLNSIHTSAPKT